MKKLLLASTALAFSAGVASAEVSMSGSAKMGIGYDESLATNNTYLMHTIGLTFTMSGQTDTGLAFGASFDASDAVAADAGTAGTVFISGEFGTLTMGDVSGAAESIVGDLSGVGLDMPTSGNENAFLTSESSTGALYQYSIDSFSIALSGTNTSTNVRGSGTDLASIAVGYDMDMFSAGIGYESGNSVSHAIAFVQGSFEGITAKATYGRATGSVDQYGISVSGTFDATTVTAYGRRDFADNTNYGLGASYDLGGGASLVGGVQSIAGNTEADFGMSFSF